jgi:hypothetical protein
MPAAAIETRLSTAGSALPSTRRAASVARNCMSGARNRMNAPTPNSAAPDSPIKTATTAAAGPGRASKP